MQLLLIGPPGAGKGTQAEFLVRDFGLTHLSSGDILRAEIASGSDRGAEAKSFIDRGQLVPDEMIVDMMDAPITEAAGKAGCLLDGFPRTEGQAKALDALLRRRELNLDAVILLEVDPELIVERLTARLSCPSCKAIFHRKNKPPKAPGICDDCGGELAVRSDDNETAIRSRLEVYANQTQAVIEHYQAQGALVSIPAEGQVDGVRQRIAERLRERGLHPEER